MATKDITDLQVCEAVAEYQRALKAENGGKSLSQILHEVFTEPASEIKWPYDILAERTGQPTKVCYRAMERAERHGFLECGSSLRSGWLTHRGEALLSGEEWR